MGSFFSCQQPVKSPPRSISDDLITHLSMNDQPFSESSSDDDVISEILGEAGIRDVTDNPEAEISDVTDPGYRTPPSGILKVTWEVPRHGAPTLLRAVSPDRRGAAVNGKSPLKRPSNRGGASPSSRPNRLGGRPSNSM